MVFAELRKINVNDKVDKKKNGSKELTYLSWTYAFDEVFKNYEDTHYKIWRDPQTHLPYVFDPMTGYMVFTEITIEGVTREMWLPVMDAHNAAMKAEKYHVVTKYSEYDVLPATMTDINKTIMRCLTKNLAMFGLGLYIYAGEDLPQDAEEDKKSVDVADAEIRTKVLSYINLSKMSSESISKICNRYKIGKISDLSGDMAKHYISILEEKSGKKFDDIMKELKGEK